LEAEREAQHTIQQAWWRQPPAPHAPEPASQDSHAPHSSGSASPDYPQVAQQPHPPAPQNEGQFLQPRSTWSNEARETGTRPAWLAAERGELAAPPLPPAPEDTLQGSRDRITSRWFALKGLFNAVPPQPEPSPAQGPSQAPVLAVFSLAGGVGKTSLVATLGRTLSARGERVLLVDAAPYGLLPFFFGARDQRPGVLRTFTPPGNSGDAPIQMLTLDTESLGPENTPQEMLLQEIARNSRNASRILVDLATASGTTTRRVLKMAPTVLVPLVPDLISVVSVNAIDTFFERNAATAGQPVLPFYVLNQFDPSLPLHLDVREVLREQLGERLLPFSLRRTPAVSEALAEGMTVVDYAPNSTVAEDFAALAGWVKNLAAPATLGFRGVRWSER
jgi:cellulose synthase operon protein YhjQ